MRLRSGFALLFLALAAGAQPAGASPNAITLLHAAAEAPQHISFVAQVQLLTIGSQGSDASVFRVEHRAPGLTRRWYLAPPNLYGDWAVSRGDATYTVDVKHRRVTAIVNESFGIHFGWRQNLDLLTRNYNAVIGPDGHVIGRSTRTISLVNRYSGATIMRLWIDTQTNLMLQREVYSTNGSLVEQMHFDDVRFTGNIPVSDFSLPAGYSIVRGPSRGLPSTNPKQMMARCGFSARAPRYLPEGFMPVAADIADEKGVRTLHLLYSDGLRTFSLFENARGVEVDTSGYRTQPFSAGSIHGQSLDRGPTTLLAWSYGGIHFTLVGAMSHGELEKIARSVVQ